MSTRRLSLSLLAVCAVAGLGFGYAALAAQTGATSQPAMMRVVKIDPRKAYMGFSKGDAMQKQFLSLQKQLGAAKQAGDNEKAGKINRQMEHIQEEVRKLMMDSLHAVVADKKIDLVLGMRPGSSGGSASDLNAFFLQPDVQVPDITPEMVTRINALAATRPALDSQPASEPASAPGQPPVLRLNPRPRVHIDTPKPSK